MSPRSPRRDAERELETLRRYRVRPAKNVSIAGDLEREVKALRKTHAASGGLDGAWEELLPGDLRGGARIERLTPAGILRVQAQGRSAAYLVEQWLRGGGLDLLRGRTSAAIKSFRVVSS